MKCPNCNKEVENLKYCVYCGALLFRECPKCKKIIPTTKEICENCNINIQEYEKGIELLKEGKKLEEEYRYEEAKLTYEKIKKIPELSKETEKLISEVEEKILKIDKYKKESEQLFNEKKWIPAKKILLKLENLLPEDKDVAKKLEIAEFYIKKRNRKIYSIIGGCIVILAIAYYINYYNKIENVAKRELMSLLNSTSIDTKYGAALILGERYNKYAIPILERFVYSKEDRKRIYAISTLINLGKREYISHLKEIMEEGDISSKIAAAWLMTRLGDTTIINKIAYWLESENEDLKITAAVLCLNMGYSSGVKIIKEGLSSENDIQKFKALYALYLLGEESYLKTYKEVWIKEAKTLLDSENEEVRLISAFLLDKVGTDLSSKDSLTIQKIMWEEFIKEEAETFKIEEKPDILQFSIVNSIINRKMDEDIFTYAPGTKRLREKCELLLAKLELKDENTLREVLNNIESKDEYEKLCAAITLFHSDWVPNKRKAVSILKKLIKSNDELLKFNTCKLVLQLSKQ